MTKSLVDNKTGLGLVAMFHQQILDEQVTWIKGQELKLEIKSLADLPPRTAQQELDMAWDDTLELTL